MKSLYLVTGGAGFIGSHIASTLLKRGDRVRVFDNLSTGKRENLKALKGAQIHEGDLRDLKEVRHAMKGVHTVFHEAALPSVSRSLEDPFGTHQSNTLGTLHLLIAAKDAKVKKVIYAGSSSAYGANKVLPAHESLPMRPMSPYAASKASGELLFQSFATSYDLPTVVLRYFNVFGPRQDASSPYSGVIALFIRNMLDGKPVTINGDGEQTRDFTYIENVVAGNLLAAKHKILPGEVINLALGNRISINDLFFTLARLLDYRIKPRYGPARVGDVRHSVAEIKKAKKYLRFKPSVQFEEGLRRTIEWYQTQ